MLALRKNLVTAAPRLARRCSFQAEMKKMEAAATKLAPSLPEGLREIAEQGTSISSELATFASERPELYKLILSSIEEADKPGIRPTVAEPKDPKACKYTEEGTMVHEMMQRVAASDRRMKLISELEMTLTAADKEQIKASIAAQAAELGVDASKISSDVPDKMKLGL